MDRMKATPEQLEAIQTHDRPVLVEAGAGSGKTWVLVQRFLYLLEQNPDWPLESLIAITFTRKATREIRSRLREAIEDQAKKSAPTSHWQARRANLEQIQVYTIHGLCSRILRENSITAGLDPRFEELDEQEADLLKEEAVRDTLEELVAEESDLLSLLASLKVMDLRNELSVLLSKRGDVHRMFESLPEERKLLQRWQEGIERMRQEVWKLELQQEPLLREAAVVLASIQIMFPDDKLAVAVEYGRDGACLVLQGDLLGALQCWLKIDRRGGKSANWGGKEALDALKENLRVFQVTAKNMEKVGCLKEIGEMDHQAARDLHVWKGLWTRLDANYSRLKAARNVLDFDDLEILAEHLLNEKPGERLEELLKGINQLMVDEFQDTNSVQQQIVYSLADPSAGGRLFIVGDAKQSIYRFRQAEVSVFNRTGEDIRKFTGQPPVLLSTSFRTHSGLVAALNDLFNHVLKPIGETHMVFEAPPAPLSAHRESPPLHKSAPAPIEILLCASESENEENSNVENSRLIEASLLAERFLGLEKDQFPVWDKQIGKHRPFQFSDAAVLLRAGTVSPLYEEQFKAAGLPYINLSGRSYYDRPEVRDIMSLLMSLYRPDDDLSLAAALRSPFFNLTDETLYRMRWHDSKNQISTLPVPLFQALQNPPPTEQPESVNVAADIFSKLVGEAWRIPVWKLVRIAMTMTGYEAALALSDQRIPGEGRQVSNIAKFMQIAREQGGSNLASFLYRLENFRAREVREGDGPGHEPESGAVQLMSIHAAKGLEFPVVAVADLGRRKQAGFSSRYFLFDTAYGAACKQRDEKGQWHKPAGYCWAEWQDKLMEEAENRRLLYVACTRAADLLLLSGTASPGESWLARILDSWDIPAVGPQDEILQRTGFQLRVARPKKTPKFPEMRLHQEKKETSLAEMPLLAGALPDYSNAIYKQSALFDAEEMDAGVGLSFSLSLGNSHIGDEAFTAGRVAHRALADWDCLALQPDELKRLLEVYYHQEGSASEAVIQAAVERIQRLLQTFAKSDVYKLVNEAGERHSEVPFILDDGKGVISGKIDLLFKDRTGDWNLIDWKTEWAPGEQEEERSRCHLDQMALYNVAVEKILGKKPKMWLCYLNPGVILVPVKFDHV
jgi:ATP-dependent helicase/nuclease subunit A